MTAQPQSDSDLTTPEPQALPQTEAPQPEVSQTETSDESVPTPPQLAGKYRFIRKIGQGSQGSVYLAERIADGAQVAIKELSIESIESFKDYDMFLREANVLASLSINGVARFYEGPDPKDKTVKSQYLVQEYIPGCTLEEYHKSGKMTRRDIYHFALQMIGILMALHRHSPPVIHRDLKPGNIIMRDMGNGRVMPYVIDFGAVANPQKQENGSTVAGTYGYMPPEQYMGKSSPACDTYALGAILVYLLTGVKPEEMEVGEDLRLRIEPIMKDVPKAVVYTLRAMLNPKVDARLSDLQILKERFSSFYAENYKLSLWNRIRAGEFRNDVSPWAVIVAILATFVFFGIVYYVVYQATLTPEPPARSYPVQPIKRMSIDEVQQEIIKNNQALDCIIGKWLCPNTSNYGDVRQIEYIFYYNEKYKTQEIRDRVREKNSYAPIILGTRTRFLNNGTIETVEYDNVYSGSLSGDINFDRTIDDIHSESSLMHYSCNERALQIWGSDKNNFVTCSRYME